MISLIQEYPILTAITVTVLVMAGIFGSILHSVGMIGG
jgi:hypothetical protein